MPSVLVPWVQDLTMMQQSVLISAVRGCDGIPKRHKAKLLLKWYRRCVLLSAFDGRELDDPFEPGGGSFTGPIAEVPAEWRGAEWDYNWRFSQLQKVTDDFLDSRDELPLHYQVHCMHAFEILGYKHPIEEWRTFWFDIYVRMAHAYHLWAETEAQMDARLGDDLGGWQARNDPATSCSD